jgi:hypothetical protein
MTDESKNEKVAKTKAPQELKPEELEKVAGGLVGDDIGLPLATGKGGAKGGTKGFSVSGSGSDGTI